MSLKKLGEKAGSWKTTAAGVLVALGALFNAGGSALDGNPETVADWPAALALCAVAVGLFMARDNDVTSKGAGAE